MAYIGLINSLRPKKNLDIKVLDLFAGCGGLGLGFEAVGFNTHGFEYNLDASSTYTNNLGVCENINLTKEYDYPAGDIIISGPPCQPFSTIGSQLGVEDHRNGFPIVINAIKKVQPKIFLIENVRGLLYSHRDYFDGLIHTLEDLGYIVEFQLINAVHFDVPQNRQRVIIIGHRGTFEFPRHSKNIFTVKNAIGNLIGKIQDENKILTLSMDSYIARYEKVSACRTPRDLHLSKPARTLTCKNLAGATGDMHRVVLQNGTRRRLTIREAARLQSFPDWFSFKGNETSQFKQIGNAVPPLLSYYFATEVLKTYYSKQKNKKEILEINRFKRSKIS